MEPTGPHVYSCWQVHMNEAKNLGGFLPTGADSLLGTDSQGALSGSRKAGPKHHIRACSGEAESLNIVDGSLEHLGQKPPGRKMEMSPYIAQTGPQKLYHLVHSSNGVVP